MKKYALFLGLLLLIPLATRGEVFRDSETAEARADRMAWWRQAKFGMFAHWGLYAAAEGEWAGTRFPDMRPGIEWLMCKGRPGGISPDMYVETLAPRMTLARFDPDAWAALAAEAGMKYFVVTAKHHDGFGMADFPDTAYDLAGSTPYGSDPMPALAAAMREHGLRFGFYFSQSQDWSKPGGRPDWFKGMEGSWDAYVDRHAVPQLRHLLGGTYGDIDVLWFDSGAVTKSQEGARKIWAALPAQPSILVNSRLKFGGRGDFDTPEQWVPPTVQTNRAWETCMTMNGSWGYNPTDPDWKSTDALIRNLCLVVSRGGNYLLNVGPRADGSLEPEVPARLRGIGAWMRVNGESIYGTEANPLGHVRWGTVTWKPVAGGSRVYCHVFDWPERGAIWVPIAETPVTARWLGAPGDRPTWTRDEDGLLIDLGRDGPIHPAVGVLALDLEEDRPAPRPLVATPSENGVIKVLAVEAEVEGGVHVHHRESRLDGWHGDQPERRLARWLIRITEDKQAYRVAARYGFNTDSETSGMHFVVSIAGQDVPVPVRVTGVHPDSHNRENNQVVMVEQQGTGTLRLSPGLHRIELRAVGAPGVFRKPRGRENKKLCHSGFAMLEELRLEPVERPNIVFFIADDMRPYHFNCLPEGKGRNLTPNLDRLAREGVLLTGQHVVSPICTPSRFSCLTGRFPSRARNSWFVERAEAEGQTVVEFNTYILAEDDTLPKRLRSAGYATGFAGKNHVVAVQGLETFPDFDASVRDPDNARQLARNHERVCAALRRAGFDEAGSAYHNNPDFLGLGDVAVQNMDWITETGVDLIERHHDAPFFLYFATTVPHGPTAADRSWNANPLLTAKGHLDVPPDVQPPRHTIPERLMAAGLPVNDDTANMLWLDDALGALLDKLEEKGVLDDTVLFFFSDHGQNAKGTLYQGGVHNPSIAWRKGGFPCGSEMPALLSNVDFAPTILELAGVVPEEGALDGQSFLPYLEGAPPPTDRALYFELGYARGIRRGDWKYIALRYPDAVTSMSDEERAKALETWNAERRRKHLPIVTEDPSRPFSHLTPIPGGGHAEVESTGKYPGYYDSDQLYDLSQDPGEQHNLAADPAYAERLKILKDELSELLKTLPGSVDLQP